MSENDVQAISDLSIDDGSNHSSDSPKSSPSASEKQQMHRVEEQLMHVLDSQRDLYGKEDHGYHVPKSKESPAVLLLPIHKPHAYPCMDTRKELPTNVSRWPQAPVMLRPSPSSDTKIRGLRYASSMDYQHFKGFCAGCILPINNGCEAEGKSLVIDFESKHFVGTLLLRIRDSPASTIGSSAQDKKSTSYFDGKKRRFQSIVKGRFKTPLAMSDCVTGQVFDRPAGKLPARWIISSFIKFVSTLAPQMEATIDGHQPRFLTPLVSTAQTVLSKPANKEKDKQGQDDSIISREDQEKLDNYNVYAGSKDIEAPVEEPPATDATSVLQEAKLDNIPNNTTKSVSNRQAYRKKCFNTLYANKDQQVKFDLDREYTFEFYQHLLVFGDTFALDMGRAIGKVPLAPATDGQPLKFMAAYKEDEHTLDYLWSFDIWHSSLYPYAQECLTE